MKVNQKLRTCIVCFCTLFIVASYAQNKSEAAHFFAADNGLIQYVGRIDFTNKKLPRYWQPGVYVKARFTGTFCNVIVNDEMLWGKNHNYLEIVVDDTVLHRLETKGKRDTIRVASSLPNGTHTILIAKNTEANIGYLELVGSNAKPCCHWLRSQLEKWNSLAIPLLVARAPMKAKSLATPAFGRISTMLISPTDQ